MKISMGGDKKNHLILEKNLQSYFLDELIKINKKMIQPLSSEVLYYTSIVFEQYTKTHHYFEEIDGKLQEKKLGVKLLKSSHLSIPAQIRLLRDVGDTSLLLCSHFSESLNRKINDINYYQNLGRIAYKKLNDHIPTLYRVSNFFLYFSKIFVSITEVISILSKTFQHERAKKFYIYTSNNTKVS